ncbi:MAG: ABC transporter ATP-binding protein [Bdellovibrionota bacterium]
MLVVKDLRTYFYTRAGVYRAVDGVSFHVNRGETLGIVGESGSGKSVSQYSLLRLIPSPPGKIVSGTAMVDGVDLLNCPLSELQKIRGKKISMIFQDPMTCLNPYMTIGDQLMEPLFIHDNMGKEDARKKAIIALEEVGIQSAETRLKSYPHELSGGMRHRVMIAMALITEPELLIADEPTTALDVTVQAQILDLIKALQKKKNTAVIFITHDLGVIAGVADRVMVMYAGNVVETAPTAKLFANPSHPYTRALLGSIPSMHERGQRLRTIHGMPPDLSKEIVGCAFAPRCPDNKEKGSCGTTKPELVAINSDHYVANCVGCVANKLQPLKNKGESNFSKISEVTL